MHDIEWCRSVSLKVNPGTWLLSQQVDSILAPKQCKINIQNSQIKFKQLRLTNIRRLQYAIKKISAECQNCLSFNEKKTTCNKQFAANLKCINPKYHYRKWWWSNIGWVMRGDGSWQGHDYKWFGWLYFCIERHGLLVVIADYVLWEWGRHVLLVENARPFRPFDWPVGLTNTARC